MAALILIFVELVEFLNDFRLEHIVAEQSEAETRQQNRRWYRKRDEHGHVNRGRDPQGCKDGSQCLDADPSAYRLI